ncbi:MAG: hypothetical protein LQ346_002743 [Caloplaca aetnensis]|nr:MAG: hypothetical protein LQ346_002743 [Caloplaca aetnensis]
MPLSFSAAHSSRVTKRTLKPPRLTRSTSSPFSTFNQRKPVQRSKTNPEKVEQEDFFGEKLDDIGLVTTLATDLSLQDVAQITRYANTQMFDSLPGRGGFNSTKIAEILNFRRSLPAFVTTAHVHALSRSPTVTEREIFELMKANVLRKIVIPGRGTGGSAVGEGLVLFKDLEAMLERSDGVDNGMKQKFLDYLRAHPLTSGVAVTAFSSTELSSLKRAGFLTSSASSASSYGLDEGPRTASVTSTSISTISRAASGSLAAIGGEGAIVEAGVSPSLRRGCCSQSDALSILQLALPNMGPYLRLLTTARTHLISLIRKSSFREVPLYLLRERWDGGMSKGDAAAQAKKSRGESSGVLPARTKKWKQFSGLCFEWVLEEGVGSGMLELFETGSVGRAVRIL